MYKFGLKLWSINKNYLQSAKELYEDGVYDYIEIYVVPNSLEYISMWKTLNIPYVIHAPHWRDGVNLAVKEKEGHNKLLIGQAQKFADELSSEKIIVHPGIAGDIKETARQLQKISDNRIIVENKPYFALDDGLLCNGSTPEEIEFVIKNANVGFCLDIGHAICAANGHRKDYKVFLQEFMELKPTMFHLSDGDINSVYDSHKNIGQGSFDFEYIFSILPKGAQVLIETEKSSKENLDCFRIDIEKLKEIIKGEAKEIHLRDANENDAKDIYNWRMDEGARQASLSEEYFDYETHLKWFNDSLKNKNRVIFIAENQKAKIGMVRFDLDVQKAKVSINIAPSMRGYGYGHKVLRQAEKKLLQMNKVNIFVADVKETNIPSRKLFESLGYKIVGESISNDGMCKVIHYEKENSLV